MAVLFEIFLSPWFRLAFSIAVANVPTSSCDQISFGNSKNLIKRSQVAIDTFAAQKISADAGNLDKFSNLTNIQHPGCSIDRNEYPNISDLAECRNSTLFTIWRPKARVIGSRGWLNDPMGICTSTVISFFFVSSLSFFGLFYLPFSYHQNDIQLHIQRSLISSLTWILSFVFDLRSN